MLLRELEWDDENLEHISRHQVSPLEVEEAIFSGSPMFFRSRYGRRRYEVYGQSGAGRYLLVVLDAKDQRAGLYRPVTAREMTQAERRRYRQLRR